MPFDDRFETFWTTLRQYAPNGVTANEAARALGTLGTGDLTRLRAQLREIVRGGFATDDYRRARGDTHASARDAEAYLQALASELGI